MYTPDLNTYEHLYTLHNVQLLALYYFVLIGVLCARVKCVELFISVQVYCSCFARMCNAENLINIWVYIYIYTVLYNIYTYKHIST